MGLLISALRVLRQHMIFGPTWSADDMPDLSGKVCLVTGGNSGIGLATCRGLLRKKAKVYLAARDEDKALAAIANLERETGRRAHFIHLDLSSLDAVQRSAKEFLQQETELHTLFNNGGVMNPPIEELTADGYDLTFGTNVLGHYYFTKLLLPALRTAAKTCPEHGGRIVFISSSTAEFGRLDFDTFKNGPGRKKATPFSMYAQSKLGLIVLAREFARLHAAEDLVCTSLHPGSIATGLFRYFPGFVQVFLSVPLVMSTPDRGALTQLYVGTSAETRHANGQYYIPWARTGTPPKKALDPALGKKLWEWLESQVKDR